MHFAYLFTLTQLALTRQRERVENQNDNVPETTKYLSRYVPN